jgi:hypothetical protein
MTKGELLYADTVYHKFSHRCRSHFALDLPALTSMPSPARLLNVILPFAAAAAATYNYVIVGGGATGLSLGVRLSEDPTKTVVVLEAGARYGHISVVFLRAF